MGKMNEKKKYDDVEYYDDKGSNTNVSKNGKRSIIEEVLIREEPYEGEE